QNVQSGLKPDEDEREEVHRSTDAEAELSSKVCYLEAVVARCLFCSLSLSHTHKSKWHCFIGDGFEYCKFYKRSIQVWVDPFVLIISCMRLNRMAFFPYFF
ncbi:MAG: hypothetical protein Q8807_04100, partial ['Waltheria sp.' little leaf phytoplasma]|nr:hypothetical protein ['Waltheria sp.' little leaf phytoplasma]